MAAGVAWAWACAAPGQGRLAGTSTAAIRSTPSVAPAGSTSDREREHAIEQMDDMRDAQQAHQEARAPAPLYPPLPSSPPPPEPLPALSLPGVR